VAARAGNRVVPAVLAHVLILSSGPGS